MFNVEILGKAKFKNPINAPDSFFISKKSRVMYNSLSVLNHFDTQNSFELAGPHKNIYFDPSTTSAAIVTCGGLCPGLNAVIRSLVFELSYMYGVKNIYGVKYGYRGFIDDDYINLDINVVKNINSVPGSILGSSRGPQDPKDIVKFLLKHKINMLFTIGGDGTLKGALNIANEIKKQNLDISVIGLPKTIDNDISHITKTFGFDTAVDVAREAVVSAHTEARGYYNSIGIVKLMGRESGFIAVNTAIATGEVNFVLIPELDFSLYGQNGLIPQLFDRLRKRHHAVIVVSEGAGQNLFKNENTQRDKSGNVKFQDISKLLKEEILKYSKENNIPAIVKLLDPSYSIRSSKINASDSIYCMELGQSAVHAAFSGKTSALVGKNSDYYTLVPIETAISETKHVDIGSRLWRTVLESTGQNL